MEIKSILEEHGIYTEAIVKLEKAINKAVGDGFVDKQRYKDKLSEIETLKTNLKTALDDAATAEIYKQKYEEEVKSHDETKKTLTKKFEDYKDSIENERITALKQSALRRHLQSDGANPRLIDLLAKEFDISVMELDGETISGWNDLSKPVKEKYADIFGKVEEKGTDEAIPPVNSAGTNPFAKSSFNLEMQTELFRKDPTLARRLAASAGIKLPT